MIRGNRHFKRWFWGLIILGILLPLIVESVVAIIFASKDFFSMLKSIFPSLILIGLLNDVPFIIFAFLVRSLWHRPEVETSQDFFKHKGGVIGAGLVGIGFVLFINISIWLSVTLMLPGFSTAVIAFIFLPIYGIIGILIGYGSGRLIGKIILRYRSRYQI
jgi:hypothetical protein